MTSNDMPAGAQEPGRDGCAGSPTIVLRSGPATATIHPSVGGRLGQLDLGRGPLLRGPSGEVGWSQWGCFPLLPWSNRLPGAVLRFDQIDEHLEVNWPDGSAIHGLAAACPWEVLDFSGESALLDVEVSSGPYRVRGMQMFHLQPDRIHLRLTATNEGDQRVPVGIGIHPWFAAGEVRLPAEQRWPGEPMPTGAPVTVSGAYDLRASRRPGPMDACFTGLTDTVVDVPGVRLRWDGPVTNVVVYTGEPDWTCVEPVTMANGAFGLPPDEAKRHGVQVLEPGGSVEVSYCLEAKWPSGQGDLAVDL